MAISPRLKQSEDILHHIFLSTALHISIVVDFQGSIIVCKKFSVVLGLLDWFLLGGWQHLG